MPEGDTIFQIAIALRGYLVGRPVVVARARQPGPRIEQVVGTQVSAVEPIGKHLLIRFSNGLTLRTHLRMGGTWHRYAPGERWRRPASQARVVLEVPGHVLVCFNAPVAELMRDQAVPLRPAMADLGPDILAADFNAEEALRRLRARADMAAGEALLDQRALAGIGNVFKSEILFLEGIHPWRLVRELDDDVLARVIATAQRLLRLNVQPDLHGRTTTLGDAAARGKLWVYGRAGRSCFRCGTHIQVGRQGELRRTTYWCPRCQPGSVTGDR